MNFFRNIPRKVLISLAVLVVSLSVLGIMFPMLGAAYEDAGTMAVRLQKEIEDTRRQTAQALDEQKYVQDHQQEFEVLLKSDRLVPHTRRAAVAELQKIAARNGISAEYVFQAAPTNSLTAAQNQPTSAAYRVSVEQISLKVSAATDGAIYRFIEDISDSFPGAAITQTVELERVPEITPAMMALLSQGKDAQIVFGTIAVIWRTAEAQDKK